MTKDLFVVYSNRHKQYYQTVMWNMPSWTRYLQDSFWCLSREKAQHIIDKFGLKDHCEIKECVATYPEGREPFIRLK